MSVRSISSAVRKVYLVAEMVCEELPIIDQMEGKRPDYFLNEIVSVWGSTQSAAAEAERLAKEKGGTYSVFEHEVRNGLLM